MLSPDTADLVNSWLTEARELVAEATDAMGKLRDQPTLDVVSALITAVSNLQSSISRIILDMTDSDATRRT